ncbi:MAG: HlyD family efflux transporter periplasmic adaptor subunit [Acidobacteriota bacterium]
MLPRLGRQDRVDVLPKRSWAILPWLWSGPGTVLFFLALIAVVLSCSESASWKGNSQDPIRAFRASAESDIPTVTVERREFRQTRRIHGTVEAVQSSIVTAPRLVGGGMGTLLITKLARGGSQARKGDLLVEFDTQDQRKLVMDRQAEYRDLVEQIKKKEAEHVAARAQDESELKQAENQVESARIEIRKNEVLTRIDAEKNLLSLEEAEARLKALRDTIEVKRSADRAEIRILEIQRDRARSAILYAEKNIEKMRITAPLSGLVVLMSFYKGGRMEEAQEGDEVRPGVPFMQVVNPAAMQVRARINQADIYDLKAGQKAEVRLDAFPDLTFPGRIEQLAAMATASQLSRYVRTFAALVSIDGSHPRLMPDLSAAVDIELARSSEALVVPRESIQMEQHQHYVRILRGDRFERRAVIIGAMNDLEAVIASGLEKGAVIEQRPPLP